MDAINVAAVAGGIALGIALGIGIWNTLLAARGRSLPALTRQATTEAERILRSAHSDVESLKQLADREVAAFRSTAEREAVATRQSAQSDANAAKERLLVLAREEAVSIKEEAAREAARRRDEAERVERRLAERDSHVSEREHRLRDETKAQELRAEALAQRDALIADRIAAVERDAAGVQHRLEHVAQLTRDEAAREVRQQVEDEARTEGAAQAREIKERARRDADRDARRIIAIATQRLAAEHTAETTVTAVPLPSDEMKGRIIGREGRNIRAFELATGVDVIIDDTPDTVVVSCFDPVRREVARRALEALVADGRIHPGRIEDLVAKAREGLETQFVELGERAAYEVEVHGLHPELIKLIGRMRYRTSYGQNLYEHSKEVAWLAGMMAAELHLDIQLARRGGLLHDIGKVLTHDHEGTHVQLGVEVCRRHGELPLVLNAIEAHHDDVAHDTAESVLVQAADAISGARPGARREAFESYMKRLGKLEEIASAYPGVEKTTVIQAGREIRVIVKPEQIDDTAAQQLSETIARRIEAELQYPGQIRVTVIRETRATGVAK
jgi:ribonuclease Y